jgi:hypothetical protein
MPYARRRPDSVPGTYSDWAVVIPDIPFTGENDQKLSTVVGVPVSATAWREKDVPDCYSVGEGKQGVTPYLTGKGSFGTT